LRSVPHLLIGGLQAEPEFELATSLSYITSKRRKAGLIRKRPVERLDFLIKILWPLRTISADGKTLFFDPLGLFGLALTIEPLQNIREAMQQVSGPTLSAEELKIKLERAQGLIPEPKIFHKIDGLVPVYVAKDILHELIEGEGIPGIKLQDRISEEEFLEKAKEGIGLVDLLKKEVVEINAYMDSLFRLKSSLEKESMEKEEEIRKIYETRIEDAKRYLGSKAELEIKKLKEEMKNEIEKFKEILAEPLNALNSLLERLEKAKSNRESFVRALEENAPEGLEFEVPFMIASLSGKEGRRFLVIPPSSLSKLGIGGKLRKAFGAMVVPIETRSQFYERMKYLLDKELLDNVRFSSYISEIGSERDLVARYSDLIMKGITRLRDMEILDEDEVTEVMSMIL